MQLPLLALLLAAGATAALAAEAASGSSTPAGAGSIEAAKRELDAIKAARNPATQPAPDLPRIAAPELQLSSPAASPWPTRERASKAQLEAERKAKNWLIEGVEKEKRLDRAAREGRVERTELESERVLAARDALKSDDLEAENENVTAGATTAADPSAAESARARERESPETPASNPLAGYMAGWMTPQDFALLQPHLAGAGASSATPMSGSTASGAMTSSAATAPVVDFTPGGFGGSKPAQSADAPRDNPYLSALLPPAQVEAVLIAPPPTTMVAPPTPPAPAIFAPAPMPEPAAPKSKIPEFAKPPADEKYFKQLKRF